MCVSSSPFCFVSLPFCLSFSFLILVFGNYCALYFFSLFVVVVCIYFLFANDSLLVFRWWPFGHFSSSSMLHVPPLGLLTYNSWPDLRTQSYQNFSLSSLESPEYSLTCLACCRLFLPSFYLPAGSVNLTQPPTDLGLWRPPRLLHSSELWGLPLNMCRTKIDDHVVLLSWLW